MKYIFLVFAVIEFIIRIILDATYIQSTETALILHKMDLQNQLIWAGIWLLLFIISSIWKNHNEKIT
jgi:hypothetical protein